MVNMVKLLRPYRCTNCSQDMLFFVTKRGTLINYRELAEKRTLNELKECLYKSNIVAMKCMVCSKTYTIDWRDKWPKPLVDEGELSRFGV